MAEHVENQKDRLCYGKAHVLKWKKKSFFFCMLQNTLIASDAPINMFIQRGEGYRGN